MQKESDVINALEASGLLKVHVETIRRLARRREIPAFKVGKDWRFYKSALRQWTIEQGAGEPEAQRVAQSPRYSSAVEL